MTSQLIDNYIGSKTSGEQDSSLPLSMTRQGRSWKNMLESMGANPTPTLDGLLPLNQFQVAFAIPVGDSFVVFTDFPAPGGHQVLHEVRSQILPRELALLQQVGGA